MTVWIYRSPIGHADGCIRAEIPIPLWPPLPAQAGVGQQDEESERGEGRAVLLSSCRLEESGLIRDFQFGAIRLHRKEKAL